MLWQDNYKPRMNRELTTISQRSRAEGRKPEATATRTRSQKYIWFQPPYAKNHICGKVM
jgi:hypothetical protein